MSDDWGVAGFDLDAYLARLGISADMALPPTGETLTRLHRAHLAAIPFENLDIMLGRGVRADLTSIEGKLVKARRGGYCFEHGQVFGAALERVGFTVDRLLARVWRPEVVSARTHLTLRVRSGKEETAWLADVGFGSGPPGPVPLGATGPHEIDGWTFAVTDCGPRAFQLRELQGDQWVALYTVEEATVYPVDIEMSNHFTATFPGSWFTHQPIIARRDPDAIRSLLGRAYTVTRRRHVKERRELNDREWADALGSVFGLALSEADRERLVATADGI